MFGIAYLIFFVSGVGWFIWRMLNLPQIKTPRRDPMEDARGFDVLPPKAERVEDGGDTARKRAG
jgi:hypothetical protein